MKNIDNAKNKLERRVFVAEDVELRVTDGDKPKLVGYAAKYNKWSQDLGGFTERIRPGAFDDVVNDNVVALKNHDPNYIIGRTENKTVRLKSNSVGLHFEIDTPNTTVGKDTVEEVRSGLLQGCSFAFSLAENGDEWVYNSDGTIQRTINQLEQLFDISVCVFPAYMDTTVSARSLGKLKETIEKRDVTEETEQTAEETAEVAEEAKEETEETEDPAIEYISDERMRQCWVGYRKAGRILNRLKQANACDKDRAEVPADKT